MDPYTAEQAGAPPEPAPMDSAVPCILVTHSVTELWYVVRSIHSCGVTVTDIFIATRYIFGSVFFVVVVTLCCRCAVGDEHAIAGEKHCVSCLVPAPTPPDSARIEC